MENIQLGSDRDPTGSVFLSGNRILRGIQQEFRQDYLSILNQPAVQGMLGEKIVETRVEEQNLPGYTLTLEHRRIAPPSYCYEWPLQMLQDAAVLTLDICIGLNDTGAVLKDGTPWNILFDGPKPLLVDFTSIMPQEQDLLWVAYDQFFRLFLFPLLVGQALSGRTSRALLLDSGSGIRPEEITHFLPALAWLKNPWLINRLYLPMLTVSMLRKSGQDKEISKYRRSIPLKSPGRRTFFEALKRDVLSLQFSAGRSHWSRYYDDPRSSGGDINTFFEQEKFHAKQRLVNDLLRRCNPSTVVDIGCNQGGYAILAAQAGAKVTAFDTDEDSVTMLYRLAKLKHLDILPLVNDVLYPSPQAGWRGVEFSSAPARFRSQMALALALVHHLAITHIQTFDRIVTTLTDYTDRWLITEFVPLEDPRSQELLVTNRRDLSWYTLEAFIDALKKEFTLVETFPSHPAGRTLCFCQK
jgi:SAM-dependent methyltransferase